MSKNTIVLTKEKAQLLNSLMNVTFNALLDDATLRDAFVKLNKQEDFIAFSKELSDIVHSNGWCRDKKCTHNNN